MNSVGVNKYRRDTAVLKGRKYLRVLYEYTCITFRNHFFRRQRNWWPRFEVYMNVNHMDILAQ
ncbi:hypothetical protein V1477_009564 [Vespula maculifrons]|uniref:Uncharacterized protein n=1 Tax=Vespula maculifrons TaxID=7453 RepID=A0ABD2CA45_VESMC